MSGRDPQLLVRELCAGIGHPIGPATPELRTADLRAKLIIEEPIETAIALVGAGRAQTIVQEKLVRALEEHARKGSPPPNLIDAIDGGIDTLVVNFGMFEAIGVHYWPFYEEVHAANMRKLGGPVAPDGKRLKPPGWVGPDHVAVFRRLGVLL